MYELELVAGAGGGILAQQLLGHLTVGGYNMQLFDFAPEVIDMIIAAIIYCGALSLLFKGLISKIQFRKEKDKAVEKSEKDNLKKEE